MDSTRQVQVKHGSSSFRFVSSQTIIKANLPTDNEENSAKQEETRAKRAPGTRKAKPS